MRLCNVFLILFLCISAFSCKYEEGPLISFTSKNKRIERKWIMTHQWINGEKTDNPSLNYIQEYQQFGVFRAQNQDETGETIIYEEGGWEFENKDNILHMSKSRRIVTPQGVRKYETLTHIATILRLTKDELRYEYMDTDGNFVKEYYQPY